MGRDRAKRGRGAGAETPPPRPPLDVLRAVVAADAARQVELAECHRLGPEIVAAVREALDGITRDELARRLGTAPSYLSGLANGHFPPGMGLLRRLHAALEAERKDREP